MSPLCFGNWKLNKSPNETENFLKEFDSLVNDKSKKAFVFFPQALSAYCFKNSDLAWGAQNIYFKNSGAFTGENSAEVLKEMGAKYSLVGHSERRSLFDETDKTVSQKVKHTLDQGLTPIVCIGETLGQRESDSVFTTLEKQLDEGLMNVDLDKVIIAYEPVWAIGTGKTASPKEVEEVHDWLRSKISNSKTPLLYGGSVKPENAKSLYSIKDVNGFLVGGASLKPSSFYEIYKNMINS
jgi:triosephosphate isomerase